MDEPITTVIARIGPVEIAKTAEGAYTWRCTACRDRSISASESESRVRAGATQHANRCWA